MSTPTDTMTDAIERYWALTPIERLRADWDDYLVWEELARIDSDNTSTRNTYADAQHQLYETIREVLNLPCPDRPHTTRGVGLDPIKVERLRSVYKHFVDEYSKVYDNGFDVEVGPGVQAKIRELLDLKDEVMAAVRDLLDIKDEQDA
jgi:hypothetical protein